MALLELTPITATQSRSRLEAIPEGAAGIRATLNAMIRAARIGATTLQVRELAESIISDISPRDYSGQLAAIQQWVRSRIRYMRDPVTAEMLKDPVALLASPYGDCDDQATLVAALVMTIGFPARFVAIGTEERGVFDHVYAEAKLGTVWLSVETTEPVPVGWIPPESEVKSKMIRHA